ncbi:hypothetical protein [Lachnoclostridium phytofermentans]|uniref:Cellobiose phosphorylase n=1 Tax=Lachnoclostridium phytofermentans (strain ATCC 700394 / DSM 18823 / ISDg) TaxID=357809 RepID=A9KLC2_LACP7|nr:hypothetical protein [Lachnoclostridium phytofermentans]ABX41251.1 conserved hypothetical protein [Lachnoclostridium phytofermentans ISDg]
MFDNKGRFVIKNYLKESTFASFLPGISGKYGIPIWCFYVNRGQAVTSFGVLDKDHSIMEFYPAHQAYQMTKTNGFRTFLKIDHSYTEAFSDAEREHAMYIGMNELVLEDRIDDKICVTVTYFTLPNVALGGLVRKVTVKNIGNTEHMVELLDGMPSLIPYGVSLNSMKEMGQTTKAWMQVENLSERLPFFKVRASMEDSACVQEVIGGHFSFAYDGEEFLPVLVDPYVVFDYDTSLTNAIGFREGELNDLLGKNQVVTNNLPCSFFAKQKLLMQGEEFTIHEVIGQAQSIKIVRDFAARCETKGYFKKKYEEAISLTDELCKGIETKTASPAFDAYCKQTYLDNILRGGYPIKLGKDKIFYLYSRKHGDIERDYNFFSMLPEYYSQGNANFRDVNQNRRCDVLFSPYVEKECIKTFYNLIQMDGYNPLAVQKATFYVPIDKIEEAISMLPMKEKENGYNFFQNSFTPGSFLGFLEQHGCSDRKTLEDTLAFVMELSENEIAASFGEGYWVDHWTYNLDLIEAYLLIYPEREEELFYKDNTYTYFESKAIVKRRQNRYVETKNGLRQYQSLDKLSKKDVEHKQLRCEYGKGPVYETSLIEKLLLLVSIKFATLDSEGMGIEMEAGKPGWYDALNGLPGIFGSSMCETIELERMISFVLNIVKRYPNNIPVALEIKELMEKLYEVSSRDITSMEVWNLKNNIKEDYREKTKLGVEGTKEILSVEDIRAMLTSWSFTVKNGIKKAVELGKGICPTYFYYKVKEYEKTEDGIFVKAFELITMPYFLEGPVRFLKLEHSKEEKKALYNVVKSSNLYDRKLKMYKVNESLHTASFEIGRSTAFTPGWLENESIWLHMEYKYYLELLKSGLYEEYFEDFKNGLIPFLDEKMYGRSILENSSFLASSANPDEKIHGKGFVARLSGSTAEFIHMWQIMMFGHKPFRFEQDELHLALEPILPEYLIGEDGVVEATLLGTIPISYKLSKKKALIPGTYQVESYTLQYQSGETAQILDSKLPSKESFDVREGRVKSICVSIR